VNILVLYYSQSGQLKAILKKIASEFDLAKVNVECKAINTEKKYPFPWQKDDFFNVMPESVLGITEKVTPLTLNTEKYDLIILGFQVWYLSPSIPVWSFLNDKKYSAIFENTQVITVIAARNMWVAAYQTVKERLDKLKAKHSGNIVFVDKNNNLVSVLTIIKWMFTGNKGPYKHLPEAGVASNEIQNTNKFGKIINEWINSGCEYNLQAEIVKNGGIPLDFSIKTMELNAKRIFKVWAKIIRKKGTPENKKRLFLVRAFKNYLLFLIFGLSPVFQVIFSMIYYIFYPFTKRNINNISLMKK
jgi:hypothetical protein